MMHDTVAIEEEDNDPALEQQALLEDEESPANNTSTTLTSTTTAATTSQFWKDRISLAANKLFLVFQVVAVASLLGWSESKLVDQHCRSFFSPNIPAPLQEWQTTSVGTRILNTQINLPVTGETLFVTTEENYTGRFHQRASLVYRKAAEMGPPTVLATWKQENFNNPNFVTPDNETTCFQGRQSFDAEDRTILCYSHLNGVTTLNNIRASIDPIVYNNTVWFKGKGPKNARVDSASTTNRDSSLAPPYRYKNKYFIYSLNLETMQVKIQCKASCTHDQIMMNSWWCRLPINAQRQSLVEFIGVRHCDAAPQLLAGLAMVGLTWILTKHRYIPPLHVDVTVFLLHLGVTILAVALYYSFSTEDSYTSEAQFFAAWFIGSGIVFMLIWRVVRGSRPLLALGVLHVGIIAYFVGWTFADTQSPSLYGLLVTVPLYGLMKYQQDSLLLKGFTAFSAILLVGKMDASMVLVLAGMCVVCVSLLRVDRRLLRVGGLLYFLGWWGHFFNRLDQGDFLILVWNIVAVALPLASMGWFTKDSGTWYLVGGAMALEVLVLAVLLIVEAMESIGHIAIVLGYLAMLATIALLLYGCRYVLLIVLEIADHPDRFQQVLQRQREKGLPCCRSRRREAAQPRRLS